jgi:SAM-dependent methyltransferase
LILDAGGGPGRYTVTLASKGYEMILFDMTPANLEFAKRQIKQSGVQDRVKDVVEGSIVDLSRFADNTFFQRFVDRDPGMAQFTRNLPFRFVFDVIRSSNAFSFVHRKPLLFLRSRCRPTRAEV